MAEDKSTKKSDITDKFEGLPGFSEADIKKMKRQGKDTKKQA